MIASYQRVDLLDIENKKRDYFSFPNLDAPENSKLGRLKNTEASQAHRSLQGKK